MFIRFSFLFFIVLFTASCATPSVKHPQTSTVRIGETFRGVATWYGKKFNHKKTASGERFNMNELTAAHRQLPFGTKLEVTNLSNDKKVIVRINDRGPFIKGRILDLSFAAAKVLGFTKAGTAQISARVIDF